jgi:hypothetical protein
LLKVVPLALLVPKIVFRMLINGRQDKFAQLESAIAILQNQNVDFSWLLFALKHCAQYESRLSFKFVPS